MITKNYDLNIWDKLSYETSGKEQDGWVINVYLLTGDGDDIYGNGPMLEDKTIYLDKAESKQLTLGWGKELGGAYAPDEDFWLDIEGFIDIYDKLIPERILNLLNELPEYDTSLV